MAQACILNRKEGPKLQDSHEVLKSAIDRVGTKVVARELGMSPSLIYKWCQPKPDTESYLQGGAINPLDRVRKLYELTGDQAMISWICQLADGYFVKNPASKSSRKNVGNVLTIMQGIIREFSETLDAISKSYNNDRKIGLREAVEIRKEWEELKSLAEAFVKECEGGRYKG